MTLDLFLNWDRETALAAAKRLTFLHPNLITTASLIIAVAGLCLLSSGNTWASGLAGAFLIFASRWLDWIDGFVARATSRCSNFGGLFDIAVGYFTMVGVMAAIGHRTDDALLIWIGMGAAVLLRLVLMTGGWLLSKRQHLSTVQWNPQKLLLPRQPAWMRRVKWALDICRNDYSIILFALPGATGLQAWGWFYTVAVMLLTIWVAVGSFIFVSRVSPAPPFRSL